MPLNEDNIETLITRKKYILQFLIKYKEFRRTETQEAALSYFKKFSNF